MALPSSVLTRRRALLAGLGLASLTHLRATHKDASDAPKILLVVAHPDDEYACAATVYRLAQELGAIVDQVIITNGESGFRYSSLAEKIYRTSLSDRSAAQERLPEIRRKEAIAAGRILNVRRHYFLQQHDGGLTVDASQALSGLWNLPRIRRFLDELLRGEQYDFVIGWLPTIETHGHHQAATILAAEAVHAMPLDRRPVLLGVTTSAASDRPLEQPKLNPNPLVQVLQNAPEFQFDRRQTFGFRRALSYQIVVNWVIAEHKSQGMFQNLCNKDDLERFSILAASGPGAAERTAKLFVRMTPS